MAGIYISNMEMPQRDEVITIYPDGTAHRHHLELRLHISESKAVPVPEHGRLLKVLKTERECVSRDCDRNCGKCDLSMERSEIMSAYDALIAVLAAHTIIPADTQWPEWRSQILGHPYSVDKEGTE